MIELLKGFSNKSYGFRDTEFGWAMLRYDYAEEVHRKPEPQEKLILL